MNTIKYPNGATASAKSRINYLMKKGFIPETPKTSTLYQQTTTTYPFLYRFGNGSTVNASIVNYSAGKFYNTKPILNINNNSLVLNFTQLNELMQ